MRNTINNVGTLNKFKNMLGLFGQGMDHDDPRELLKDARSKSQEMKKNYFEEIDKISNQYPCPSEHEKNIHNRILEEGRFKNLEKPSNY